MKKLAFIFVFTSLASHAQVKLLSASVSTYQTEGEVVVSLQLKKAHGTLVYNEPEFSGDIKPDIHIWDIDRWFPGMPEVEAHVKNLCTTELNDEELIFCAKIQTKEGGCFHIGRGYFAGKIKSIRYYTETANEPQARTFYCP